MRKIRKPAGLQYPGSLIFIFLLLAGMACTAGRDTNSTNADNEAQSGVSAAIDSASGDDPGDGHEWSLPYFGFNAKGTMDVSTQIAYANKYFDHIPDWIKSNMVIRVTGGTRSQKTYKRDWTRSIINQWVSFQQKQGVRFIFVVNGNDTPANQRDIINEWLQAGAHFDFLEMMNEYYLPKFAKGLTDRPEVTRKVTAKIYANEILPAFWAELDQFHLPYYIIFAPSRPGRANANARMQEWNNTLINDVVNKYPDKNINATIHLYLRKNPGSYDYNQIDKLRRMLPSGRHIAVTEAGVLNKEIDYKQAGRETIAHYKNILKHLNKGDYLLDQVLYNQNRRGNTAILSPVYKGETPKGQQMLQFITNRLK